ncbi:MAG: urea carboxylase [Thiohalomonadaceae bacterium]
MFNKVLIANRGEIAVRILRTLKRLHIASVAVYAEPDRYAQHVQLADEAVALGGSSASESYLRGDRILEIARETGAEAIIPGYGFLSENAAFAEACEKAGIAFVGPTADQMRRFGLKHTARELAVAAEVPLTPGTDLLRDVEAACEAARDIGYPVMLKSTAGGGGIGLSRCADEAELRAAFASVQRLGENFFSDSGVFIERFVGQARHVEVQIFGDGRGQVLALGERDCSLQRRNQKVIEETPAPDLPAATRSALLAAARRLAESVSYRSAGTVEFLYEPARDAFYFLEMNTRLQVEHPVTELVSGVDLVEWMLCTAAGQPPALDKPLPLSGAAIEARIYAEDPLRDFQPSPGVLSEVSFPSWARVDTYVQAGTEVSSHFDPMIAKLIVYGKDRDEAISRMGEALAATRIGGIASNLDYLRQIVAAEFFQQASLSTTALADFRYHAHVAEVIAPGTYSTIQDNPGRMGYWHIGVPPSGPMDDYAFDLANRLVGNSAEAAALECTVIGATLRFHSDTTIALSGAPCNASLDGKPMPQWQAVKVSAGQILEMGRTESGCRSYLAVAGGFDVPMYLGSRATFALGKFGGHAGRPLKPGDMLPLGDEVSPPLSDHLPEALIPDYQKEWTIGVLYGPHGAPDFFDPEFIESFFSTSWEVHYNSNRLGIRLMGPRPKWTRSDGGEAGLHPSNIHDTEYAIGAINFTGDMPVILGKDGPSLGGFVCPATIVKAELWKMGQLKPGDRVRFMPLDAATAHQLDLARARLLDTLQPQAQLDLNTPPMCLIGTPILAEVAATAQQPKVVCRQAGDSYVLLEYGENVLDLRARFRVHALMEALKARKQAGIEELSPGVRSLQVRYDSMVISVSELVAVLMATEQSLPPVSSMRVPTRILHLPLAFEDSATLEAVDKYRQSVRDEAPWLPSNAEFIRRINGLDSIDEVRELIYQASYLVMGLGDVYLGAPCAVPVDPRHRLRTSKYNPARTYTAEGTVGIGGVYMCIYGMDSPGGYQLVGRTLPIWNTHLHNPQFSAGKPWLLRFFDQVRYYPVSESELLQLREDFRHGLHQIQIEESEFDLAEYERFLETHAASIAEFRQRQDQAFGEEVARWSAEDFLLGADAPPTEETVEIELAEGEQLLSAEITGSVWKYLVEPGASVQAGEPLLILEAMKMEFSVSAPAAGTVVSLHGKVGGAISHGDPLVVIKHH